MSSIDLVSAAARGGQRAALLVAGGRTLSYAELDGLARRFAAQLGQGEKQLVAISAETSEHVVAAYLGALQAGHAVAMLPPCDDRLWEDFLAAFQPDFTYRPASGRWRLVKEASPARNVEPLHPDLALLLMTSGSSGAAKAVRLSYANLEANARSIATYLELSSADRAALVLPLQYSYGLSVLNSHLIAGGSILFPGVSVMDGDFLGTIADAGCTNLSGVPYSFELLERVHFRDAELKALRMMTVAGGPLSPDLIRLYRDHMRARGGRFFVMYGQTEATARIAFVPPESLSDREERIGVAVPGGSLGIVDVNGEPIDGPGIPGELVYRGPNVMMGYATRRCDLARGAEVGALNTGDIAMQDERGFFRIVGRKSRFAKIAGLRIGFDVMEQALERAGIAAAVLGDDRGLQAYVTDSGSRGRAQRILAEASRLPANLVRVEARKDFPRLASGKVDYACLDRERLEARTEIRFETGGVLGAYARVFYPLAVGRNDSFVSLGGDSLRFLQLVLELERLGLELPDGWERLSVAELAGRKGTMRPLRHAQASEIPVDLVLRVIAILLVVVHHETLWPIPGGSGVMMLLVGYSLARFQSDHFRAGRIRQALRPAIDVLIPYFLTVAAYAVAWRAIPWASMTLTGNLGYAEPERHEMIPYLYWFIEAYAQTLLVFALIFAIPAVRKLALARLFVFSLGLLVFAAAARFSVPLFFDWGNRQIFAIHWVFHVAVFGWCAGLADTPERRLVVTALAAAVLGYLAFWESVWLGTTVKYAMIFAGLLALLYLPRVRLSAGVARVVTQIAVAAFPIYLFHRFVPEQLMAPAADLLPAPVFKALAIVGGIAIGIIASKALAGIRTLRGRSAMGRQPQLRSA
ncbi:MULTISPECIES: AMP-binding protein [unclassified Mesorhizobium]|uniref:AMP-binding protein n=1 Tax=unclassified Mesorhizobium TaxID=325217 RepID=UPI000BAFEEE4|nr:MULTISPECIES: AMP-binding protein [unclassified Mesorhizobium]PBB87510.1 AMP-dependent synthetase [Mesorhizobium sp. WSM3876]RWB74335.1 MAG: AMP-dependent synthetase [Mesorhizobium sp.]RWB88322.1 MAG: AMP-dependent synthetase [Mesorhizobium sp.]RWE27736.1 MAG: AMP-dependent synthetase [Mesorhizobium sp.]RWE35395.1 MAG: AMP-dependent synthetase [Mesorhizobium sp.]